MKQGKRLRAAYEGVDRQKQYPLAEAIKLIKGNARAKFDETVELSMNLGIDPRHADQMVRGLVSLPNGTGKTLRVAVFARGAKAEEAQAAGADVVGADDLAERVQAGDIQFDRAIATPDMMALVGRLGKILGPRGLMPNPKSGTVTQEIGRTVEEFSRGKMEYRVDRYGIIHGLLGKKSFELDALVENYFALRDELQRARPSAVKGRYFKAVTLSTTMGPSVKVDPNVERE